MAHKDRLRVLVLTPDFPPRQGGIQLLAHRLLAHATRLKPRVVTVDAPGAAEFDRVSALDVRRVPRLGGSQQASNLLMNLAGVREGLRFRPEIVLSMHIVGSPAARAVGGLTDVPVVQYVHAKEVRARPRLAAFAVRRADATVAVSEHGRRLALESGVVPTRVRVIHPGVDLPPGGGREPAREPLLVTVSRLADRHKGHDVVLRALPSIRARIPDVRWVVVGDGPLRPGLSTLARELGVADCVDFVGAVRDSERDAWLRRARIFVMPSRLPAGEGGEGFGIVFLEAGAHGVPVVAGDVGGSRDAVLHGETGLLVDPEDTAAVADAISELLSDPNRAEALGRAGKMRASALTWPAVARELEELLIEVRVKRDRGGIA